MAAGHVSENALYARVGEEMYSQTLPTYKLEHIEYLYLTMKSGYYLVSKISNL